MFYKDSTGSDPSGDARAASPWPAYGTPWPGARDPGPEGGAGDPAGWSVAPVARGSLALFLALYLLLLAFFIMLTALSSMESQRVDAVMESLTLTFSPARTQPPNAVVMPLDDLTGEAQATEAFIALVSDLFQAAMPAVQVRAIGPGPAISVDIRGDSLFRDDDDTLRPSRRALLDGIVAALSTPPPGLRFEMAAVVRTAASASAGPDMLLPVGPDDLSVRRAAMLGRGMTQRGAPPGSVLVGLAPGDPVWMQLTFRAVDQTRWDPDFGAVPADAVAIDAPDAPDAPDAHDAPAAPDQPTRGVAPQERPAFMGAQPGPSGDSIPQDAGPDDASDPQRN
jgi:hypothetical protein